MSRAIPTILPFLLAAPAALAQVSVPPGFRADVFAQGPEISYVTSIAFDGDGVLHAGEADVITGTGRVLRLEDRDGDGKAETVSEFATGFGLVTGITFHSPLDARPPRHPRSRTDLERIRLGEFKGRSLELYVSHFTPGVGGAISGLLDQDKDGVAEQRREVVTGLPSDGVNGNQQIAVDGSGRLYFGQGARTNAGVPGSGPPDGPLNGTILRVDPDGSDLTVYARGLRNSYDLAFTPAGELFATENGPDASGPNPVVGAPDELNVIRAGGDYGWPKSFGFPAEGTGTFGPFATFSPSTSTDGLALMTSSSFCGYGGDFFAAQFGSFTNPAIGRRVVRVQRVGRSNVLVDIFATGFGRPLDVAVGPEGDLWVADFSNPFLAPRTGAIYRIHPIDGDGDGKPDICN